MNKWIRRTIGTLGTAGGLCLAITGTAHATDSPTTKTEPICALESNPIHTDVDTLRRSGPVQDTTGRTTNRGDRTTIPHTKTTPLGTPLIATQPGGPTSLTESTRMTNAAGPDSNRAPGMTADLLGSQPLGGHTTGGLRGDVARQSEKRTAPDHRAPTPV